MRHVGIVVAAGTGSRFGGEVPKQFIEVGGKPLLFYSLKAMQDSFIDEIIVVTSADRIGYVKNDIGKKNGISKLTHVVKGGKDRGSSVQNGLRKIKDPKNAYVYIHDGARPMLTQGILNNVKEGLEGHWAVLAAVPSKDTVKIADSDGLVQVTPNRSTVWLAQTPQAFVASEIMSAYEEANAAAKAFGGDPPTDDASVMESYGPVPVHVVMGDYRNIKVTTPEDLDLIKGWL
ncbi:MAG: 2-C-methyl-D-erythritol 4-phosphate cytidylyltransferase [Lachnospiraceae bacterium]|nr:2-C-methyl-D-erythritol 4-phosphate cytidylyltransferase [Lachnospiraceae bacterium]